MTVETNDTVERYTVSGVGPYAFSFRVFDEDEVTVTAISAGLVATQLALTTHYTVDGADDEDGGTITLVSGVDTTYAGYTLDIRSNTAEYQPTSIRNQGRFLPEVHEDVFDRLSRQIQDLSRKVRSAIRYPDDGITDAVAPAVSSRAGRYLFANATTGAFEWVTAIIGTTFSQSIFNLFLADSDQYKRTADEISAGVTPTNYAYAAGHVLRYGTNTVPGTTDMTTAFQRAALSSLSPYAPAGDYLVTASIPLRDNQHWRFDGARIAITGTTLQVFTVAAGIDDWSIRGNWSVTGNNGAAGATSGTAAAIAIIDSERWRVEGLVARNISGSGVLIQPGSSTSGRAEHGQIVAPIIDACYRGIQVEAGTGAEYVNVTAPNITHCNIGILTAAGNTNVVGGSITDNTDNVKIIAGANHAHGIFSSVNINHATQYIVHCEDVVNGQTFVGCHLYANSAASAGAIFLDECKGIQFIGGHMDCHIYNYKGAASGLNIIRDMYCPGAYGLRRLPGTNNGHDELLIMNCFGPGSIAPASDALDTAGISMNDPAFMFVLAKRAAASTQSLTSGVTADLLFNTEVSDRRGAYNPATGVTTIPAAQGGMYRIRADLVFSGTGMSTSASYVELKIGSTSYRLFTPTIFSTTKLVVAVNADIYLNAAETVKLSGTITGTTPVHGDSSYESSLTVQRLS